MSDCGISVAETGQPDINLEPRPEFFLQGGDDRVLSYAIQRIAGTRRAVRRVGR